MTVVFGVWEWIGLLVFLAGATAALASLWSWADDTLELIGKCGFAVMWIGMCVLIVAFAARGA